MRIFDRSPPRQLVACAREYKEATMKKMCPQIEGRKRSMSMRYLTLCLAVGLILAVSVPAGAISFSEAYNGPVVFHLTSRDSGTIYTVPPNIVGINIPPVGGIPGPGAIGGEDTWGVFSIDQIQKGVIVGPNNITALPGSVWNAGITDGKELVGIVWAETDIAVNVSPTGSQTIEGVGLRVAIWEQTFGVYNGGVLGSAGRLGPATYITVGTDASSSLWATAISTPGFLGSMLPGVAEFVSNFDPNVAPPGASGSANTFLSITPVDVNGDLVPDVGSANGFLNTNFFIGAGTTADLFVQMTTNANNPTNTPGMNGLPPVPSVFDGTVTNSDPVDGVFVPEPLTMLAVFTGIAGLGGYIRKRRMA